MESDQADRSKPTEEAADLAILTTSFDFASIDETTEQAKEYARASRAQNTLRAYKSDIADFTRYCIRIGEPSLPATPQTVALYLTNLSSEKSVRTSSGEMVTASVATILRRMVAIAQSHKLAGGGESSPNPVADPVVRAVIQGIKRTRGTKQTKKDALTVNHLKEVLAQIDGGGSTTGGTTFKGKRDRAMLLLTWFTACRRSEIVALNVEDLTFDERGFVVTIRKSKTDQEGAGREIGVPRVADRELCAVRAVEEWMEAAKLPKPTEGVPPQGNALFRSIDRHGNIGERLSAQNIALLVQRVTKAAGIKGDFAAHSTRAGFITSAARTKGVSEVDIQAVSGHRSVTILRGYVRRANVFVDAPATAMFGNA